jgi:hypothetical protein
MTAVYKYMKITVFWDVALFTAVESSIVPGELAASIFRVPCGKRYIAAGPSTEPCVLVSSPWAPDQNVTVDTRHLRVSAALASCSQRRRGIRHVDKCSVLHVQRN